MATTQWVIDPTHSEVLFKVKHLVISTVTGSFGQFSGSLTTENEDFTDANIHFTAQVDSINTNNAQRDGHLKSADFFAADQYPELNFQSTAFKKVSGGTYELHGNLTIKGTTQPVKLAVEMGGIAQDPYGNTKAGFEIEGKINRKDFGLTWSAVTEAGGVVVSDEVKLLLNIQLVKVLA